MDVVKTYLSLLLWVLILSTPLVAEEAAETDDPDAGTYLIDESESQVVLDGELTPEGERALQQARERGELPNTDAKIEESNPADAK